MSKNSAFLKSFVVGLLGFALSLSARAENLPSTKNCQVSLLKGLQTTIHQVKGVWRLTQLGLNLVTLEQELLLRKTDYKAALIAYQHILTIRGNVSAEIQEAYGDRCLDRIKAAQTLLFRATTTEVETAAMDKHLMNWSLQWAALEISLNTHEQLLDEADLEVAKVRQRLAQVRQTLASLQLDYVSLYGGPRADFENKMKFASEKLESAQALVAKKTEELDVSSAESLRLALIMSSVRRFHDWTAKVVTLYADTYALTAKVDADRVRGRRRR